MDGSLAVAVTGVVLALFSLVWQAATFALTGGRLKVKLTIGATGRGSLISIPISEIRPDTLGNLAAQGYAQPVAIVTAADVGRLPITVSQWSLKSIIGSMQALAESIGPPLPHRLEIGESASWAVPLQTVRAFAESSKALRQQQQRPTTASFLGRVEARMNDRPDASTGLVAVVELADGRKRWSVDTLPYE